MEPLRINWIDSPTAQRKGFANANRWRLLHGISL